MVLQLRWLMDDKNEEEEEKKKKTQYCTQNEKHNQEIACHWQDASSWLTAHRRMLVIWEIIIHFWSIISRWSKVEIKFSPKYKNLRIASTMSGLVDMWVSELEKLKEKGRHSFFSGEPSGQVKSDKCLPEKEELVSGHRRFQSEAWPVLLRTEITIHLLVECLGP